MCIIMHKITGLICACATYKGCGPSARLELPPDNFSRNAPGGMVGTGKKHNDNIKKCAEEAHLTDEQIRVSVNE